MNTWTTVTLGALVMLSMKWWDGWTWTPGEQDRLFIMFGLVLIYGQLCELTASLKPRQEPPLKK